MKEATKKQTWAIFCIAGYDVRPCDLTVKRASEVIQALNNGGFDFSTLPNAIQRKNGTTKKRTLEIKQNKTPDGKSRYSVIFPDGGRASWSNTGCYYNSCEGLASMSWTIHGEYTRFCGARAAGSGKRNWKKFQNHVINGIKSGTIQTKQDFFNAIHDNEIDYWVTH